MLTHTHNRWSNALPCWRTALYFAVPITSLILWLFYYGYAIANKYVLFLYTHLNAGPFDEMTNGRYLMFGLVISGAILALMGIANWYLGRLAGIRSRRYAPPAWWRIWLLCIIPLAAGILLITLSVSEPALPLGTAAASTLTTLFGLAVALAMGNLAANHLDQLL